MRHYPTVLDGPDLEACRTELAVIAEHYGEVRQLRRRRLPRLLSRTRRAR